MDYDNLCMYYKNLLDEVRQILNNFEIGRELSTREGYEQRQDDLNSNAAWTNALLNALARIGPNHGFDPYPAHLYFFRDANGQFRNSYYNGRTEDVGEYVTDMSWWTRPPLNHRWWDAPENSPLECNLAVESEWGRRSGTPINQHIEMVADDFAKLLFMQTHGRLLITNCLERDQNEFLGILSRLRNRSPLKQGDICIWLWDSTAEWSQISCPQVVFP